MNRHLLILLTSLFVVSIGFGITLPVLPFYAERLAMAESASLPPIWTPFELKP